MSVEVPGKRPKFSIITVCLDAPSIEATCRSIVDQSFTDYEWIVVDGGSHGETLDILDAYKYRMSYFVSEKDEGIYDAMNKGIAHACGEYFNFMNGGDKFYTRDVLERVAEFIETGAADIIYGNTYFEPPKDIFVRPEIGEDICSFLYTATLIHQSCFFKASCFSTYGLYDIHFSIASDYKKFIELAKHGLKFAHLDTVVASFDTSGISLSNDSIRFAEVKRVIKELFSAEEIHAFNKQLDAINRKNALSNLRASLKQRPRG